MPIMLQQHLPPAVLKRTTHVFKFFITQDCCNNTYRLRYTPKGARQQRSKEMMKSTHRKYLSEAKIKQM